MEAMKWCSEQRKPKFRRLFELQAFERQRHQSKLSKFTARKA